MSEMQVDQETVAIVQPAEGECRNKGIEDGRRWQSSETLSVARGSSSSDRDR